MSAPEEAAFREAVQAIAAGTGGMWRLDMQFANERPTEDPHLLALLAIAWEQTLDTGHTCLSCERGFSSMHLPWAFGIIRPLQPGDAPSGVAFGLCRTCCKAGHASVASVTAKLRAMLFSDLREVPAAAIHLDGGRA